MKTETRDLGTESHPVEGVLKEEKFPQHRKPSYKCDTGELWNLRGQENRKHTHTCTHTHTHTHTQNTCLTTTTSGKAAQTLPSISNDSGLGREVCAASLFFRVRTGLNALKAI